jgi:hypothetical protein
MSNSRFRKELSLDPHRHSDREHQAGTARKDRGGFQRSSHQARFRGDHIVCWPLSAGPRPRQLSDHRVGEVPSRCPSLDTGSTGVLLASRRARFWFHNDSSSPPRPRPGYRDDVRAIRIRDDSRSFHPWLPGVDPAYSSYISQMKR